MKTRYLLRVYDGDELDYFGFESDCDIDELSSELDRLVLEAKGPGGVSHGEFKWFGKTHRVYKSLLNYKIMTLEEFWKQSLTRDFSPF
jgi:hypothetical protein